MGLETPRNWFHLPCLISLWINLLPFRRTNGATLFALSVFIYHNIFFKRNVSQRQRHYYNNIGAFWKHVSHRSILLLFLVVNTRRTIPQIFPNESISKIAPKTLRSNVENITLTIFFFFQRRNNLKLRVWSYNWRSQEREEAQIYQAIFSLL